MDLGTRRELRSATAPEIVDATPIGGLITVPKAPATGPVPQAPTVAAPTISWKKSVIVWLGYTAPVWMTVYEYFDSLADDFHDFSPRRILRIVVIGGLGLVVGYVRKNVNTVTR